MPFVDCPLCDAPAPFDTDLALLDCPVCDVQLAVAADEAPMELAAAA
jgi:hypothetical protein